MVMAYNYWMKIRCTLATASISLAAALLCICPITASGATAGAVPPAPAERGRGCSNASLAVLNDIVGSVSEDSFYPNPSNGDRSSTDPAGCGRPNRTRRGDPGNPVTPIGRPTSSFTIRSFFR